MLHAALQQLASASTASPTETTLECVQHVLHSEELYIHCDCSNRVNMGVRFDTSYLFCRACLRRKCLRDAYCR